jgi:hypothetical protein
MLVDGESTRRNVFESIALSASATILVGYRLHAFNLPSFCVVWVSRMFDTPFAL